MISRIRLARQHSSITAKSKQAHLCSGFTVFFGEGGKFSDSFDFIWKRQACWCRGLCQESGGFPAEKLNQAQLLLYLSVKYVHVNIPERLIRPSLSDKASHYQLLEPHTCTTRAALWNVLTPGLFLVSNACFFPCKEAYIIRLNFWPLFQLSERRVFLAAWTFLKFNQRIILIADRYDHDKFSPDAGNTP